MKNMFLKITLLCSLITLFSCSSDSVVTNNSSADVYISGSKNDHACYWKNNQLTMLSDNGAFDSSADTIIVANNNIHILGYGGNKHLYWKNAVLTNLTDAFSTDTDIVERICSMDIVGNDVYIAGVTQNVANPSDYDLVYWKNGVKTVVTTTALDYTFFHLGIKVVNGDVYMNCFKEIAGVWTAGYFKNDVFFPEANALTLWGCNAVNSDIYVFGSGNGFPGYYKNISANAETYFQTVSIINRMDFDNGNVYCSDDISIYKNGVLFYTIPANASPNLSYYRMTTFKVVDNSIYAITEEAHYQSNIYTFNQKLLIDDAVSIQNADDERFKSLFVVTN
ncbi:hypothetical protein [Flavobacterium wongokense]|uniref:hypothetical protein n=1 Tax=Flavobacterium wongokense TaxID=2910674 RepID=UPI001F1AAF00|nr:hypothetical protein [Flavobacterium sp. WG47]MCF6131449.1 hypothetical protein [Flavobacterium sp. WG47]